MSLIKIILCIPTVLFFYGGCCSSKYLPECSCELEVDTVEYLIPRLASYSYPLERDYIREEVKKDSIIQWVKDYYQTENIEVSLFWVYWKEVEDKLKNQDRIFYYSTINEFGGITGFIFVRDCKIICDIKLDMVQF